MENILVPLMFFLPLGVFGFMALVGKIFRGKKTYTQALLAIFGVIQTTDFGFLPQDATSALLAGVALATILARIATEKNL